MSEEKTRNDEGPEDHLPVPFRLIPGEGIPGIFFSLFWQVQRFLKEDIAVPEKGCILFSWCSRFLRSGGS